MKALKPLILTSLFALSTQAFAMNLDDLNSLFTDTMITTNIKSKIMLDKSLSNQNIAFSTNNGVVSLTGTADSLSSASLFIQTIASSYGVREIDANKLHVAHVNESLDDTVITAEIKGLFLRYEIFGNDPAVEMPVAISTQEGVVTLTEKTVITDKQLDAILKIAKSTQGVKAVDIIESSTEET